MTPTTPRLAWLALAAIVAAAGCARREPVRETAAPPPPAPRMQFQATAYSIEGRTASGAPARSGMVAADPKILPIGTRIRLHGSGPYDGEYVVQDTGPAVKGHEIDVYLTNDAEAKRFGRKTVDVEVLR